MRVVIAGGGFAGLAASLAVARAGHSAVVLERDGVEPAVDPARVFAERRQGIPHFLQPHAFLPRGRLELERLAPDVMAALLDAGGELQDVSQRLRGPRQPGDEELVYLWARRPLIEWALRRAAAAESAIELRTRTTVTALAVPDGPERRATGVVVGDGDVVEGDLVIDALGRYRPPAGWRRPSGAESDCGALYYSRYFRLRDGVDYFEAGTQNPLNPRGDIGYMGFNTFRGDNRTFAVILLTPTWDRELRILRHERAWSAACSLMPPLDVMTSAEFAEPVTEVMAMGGLMNVDRTRGAVVAGVIAVGDAYCHTDPAFAYGLSFALAHASALQRAATDGTDAESVAQSYHAAVAAEAQERFALVRATDEARSRRWRGETLDATRRDGCYPLFAFTAALAAASHDDHVLRRTIRRIGLLDPPRVFDEDEQLHRRIERILAASTPATRAGPPRDEMLARLVAAATA